VQCETGLVLATGTAGEPGEARDLQSPTSPRACTPTTRHPRPPLYDRGTAQGRARRCTWDHDRCPQRVDDSTTGLLLHITGRSPLRGPGEGHPSISPYGPFNAGDGRGSFSVFRTRGSGLYSAATCCGRGGYDLATTLASRATRTGQRATTESDRDHRGLFREETADERHRGPRGRPGSPAPGSGRQAS